MAEDRLQPQRLELKYEITEVQALRVRDFVGSYLELDEYGAGQPNGSYPVHSLYLDSDDLRLYWETINGTKNRFKLRLRFYDDRPETPVYFEIKRRMNNCILKQRGGVRREAVGRLLAGHLPEVSSLTSQSPRNMWALQLFCQRMMALQARPKAHIAYLREAWVTPDDNSVRVTLDREVHCEPEFDARLTTTLAAPVLTFGRTVILELKFTVSGERRGLWELGQEPEMDALSRQSHPKWFPEFIRAFDLMQTGAAKYADGVALLGEDRFCGNEWAGVAERDRRLEPTPQLPGVAPGAGVWTGAAR